MLQVQKNEGEKEREGAFNRTFTKHKMKGINNKHKMKGIVGCINLRGGEKVVEKSFENFLNQIRMKMGIVGGGGHKLFKKINTHKWAWVCEANVGIQKNTGRGVY